MNAAPSPEREWFDRALDVPIGARAAFLAQACPDPDVRARVQTLLDAHDRAGERFLAQSAGELAAAAILTALCRGHRELIRRQRSIPAESQPLLIEIKTSLAGIYRDTGQPEKAIALGEAGRKF